MENKPNINENNAVQYVAFFTEQLKRGREEGDIYLTARALPFLMHKGIDVSPTAEEKEEMLEKLNNARNGKTEEFFKEVEGYMLARWLMLINHFWPDSEPPTHDDISLIQRTFEKYRSDENYHQLASLIQTAKEIGIELNTEGLSETERQEIEKILIELQ
jgi:hypothetical protein